MLSVCLWANKLGLLSEFSLSRNTNIPEMSDSNPNQGRDNYNSLCQLTTIGLRLRRTNQAIDHLPDKFLKIILKKLTWSQLAHLRVVCKRWRAVIHSMGEEKKLLILNDFWYEQTNKLKRSFFGTLDFDNCARVNLKMLNASPASSLETLIVGLFPSVNQFVFICSEHYPIYNFLESNLDLLFPRIVYLSLNFDDSYVITTEERYCIAHRINALTSLKNLEICGKFYTSLLELILPTIRHRLYHLSYSNLYGEYRNELTELVRHFGPNCTRLALDSKGLPCSHISLWRALNRDWLGRLTHLQLSADVAPFDQIAQYLSVHATSLQVFRFDAQYNMHCTNGTISLLPLTAQAMNHLSRLYHLVELELKNVYFVSSIGVRSRRFLNVRICTLSCDINYDVESDQFSRILSHIFPRVEQLNITIMRQREYYHNLLMNFGDYLDRFRALRTYKFVVEESPYD